MTREVNRWCDTGVFSISELRKECQHLITELEKWDQYPLIRYPRPIYASKRQLTTLIRTTFNMKKLNRVYYLLRTSVDGEMLTKLSEGL
jgi:hypothetical protein